MKRLLFIPAYRCAAQIGRVLARVGEAAGGRFDEVCVVENRSPDDTPAAARTALAALAATGQKVVLLQNKENYNLGGSHKVAFRRAVEGGFDSVTVLHGDDQADIADLVPALDDGRADAVDCFLGSRFAKGARRVNYPWVRTAGNRALNLVLTVAARRRVLDMGSGLNHYRTAFVADPVLLSFPDDLTFNVYLLLYAFRRRSSVAFFPILWREEDQRSNARAVKQGLHILKLAARYAVTPDRLFDGPPRRDDYIADTLYSQP